MSDETSSIQQILALARLRQLWPEVEPQTEAAPVQSMQSPLSPQQPGHADAELKLRILELREQIAQALGPKQRAVQPMLDELSKCCASGAALDLDAAWTAIDELEDQLEALSR